MDKKAPHKKCSDSTEQLPYNQKTLKAIAEGKRIARDPSVRSYNSIKELKKALEE